MHDSTRDLLLQALAAGFAAGTDEGKRLAARAVQAEKTNGRGTDLIGLLRELGRMHAARDELQLAIASLETSQRLTRQVRQSGPGSAQTPPRVFAKPSQKAYRSPGLPGAGDGLRPDRGSSADSGGAAGELASMVHLGGVYQAMAQDALARRAYEAALAGASTPRMKARVHIALCALDRRADAFSAAEAHIEAAFAALDAVADGPVDLERCEALTARGALAWALGRLDAAVADLEEATRIGSGAEAIDTRQSLGELLAERGDGARARALFDEILDDRGLAPRQAWRAHWQRGRLSLLDDEPHVAVGDLEQALSIAEQAIDGLTTDEGRVAFDGLHDGLRDDLTRAWLLAGNPVQALDSIERGRATTFRRMLRARGGHDLRSERASGAQVLALQYDPEASARALPAPGHFGWNAAEVGLSLGLPRLVFAVLEAQTARFLVGPDGLLDFTLIDVGAAGIEAAVNAVYAAGVSTGGLPRFARPASASLTGGHDAFARLGALLLDDLELPGEPDVPLVIEPDGPLWRLPFAALPMRGEPLGLLRPLVMAPSAAVMVHARTVEPPRSGGVALVVGNPTMPAGEGLRPLPGAEAEARAIADALPSILLTGDAATVAAVEAELDHVDVLHLATHGAEASDPRDAWLALADGPDGESGLWTTARILELERCPALVVLSACETGRGTITRDGVIGPARAFLAAGARSVIVSLARVDDAVTARFMAHIYDALAHGPVSHALREAMRRMYAELEREGRPWPALWAPFVLIGAES